MLRIGKLTGRVYDENVNVSSIGECCIQVREENLDEELAKWKINNLINNECNDCRGCPEYYKES